jgi:transposase
MGAPVSEVLRQRIVAAWQKNKLSGLELLELFGVGETTVKWVKRRFLDTGSLKPKLHGGGALPMIGKEQELLVEALVPGGDIADRRPLYLARCRKPVGGHS